MLNVQVVLIVLLAFTACTLAGFLWILSDVDLVMTIANRYNNDEQQGNATNTPSPPTAQKDTRFLQASAANINSKTRLPDAILIGIGKCGTMATGFFLETNLKIQVTVNEIHFFSEEEKYQKGLDFYASMFPRVPSGMVLIERSPDYWKWPNSALRIKQAYNAMNRTVKLLLAACDPTKRVLSWYVGGLYHYIEEGKPDKYPSLEQLVYHPDREEISPQYTGIRTALYDEVLPMWLNHFDRNEIHIIDGEKFRNNPLVELNKIERFLGLEPKITKDNIYFDEKKGFYCRNRLGKKACLDKTKGHKYPQLNEKTIGKLADYFRPHLQKFYDQAGVDFGWS